MIHELPLDPTDTFQGWQILFHRTDTWAVYNNVDFGTAPVKQLKARVRSEKGGTITLQTIGDKGVTIAVHPRKTNRAMGGSAAQSGPTVRPKVSKFESHSYRRTSRVAVTG
ncbi:MAG: hypothetical protein ACLUHA_17690 [Bacteroides stercoris]